MYERLIATKEGKLFGYACGSGITFPEGYDKIESFETDIAFNDRLKDLQKAV